MRITPEMSREDVALHFQMSKNFYTFDGNTAVLLEAHLCGADCFVVTSDNPPRCIPWRGYSAAENEHLYNDLTQVHSFVNRAKEFFK